MVPGYFKAANQSEKVDDVVGLVRSEEVGELYLAGHYRGIKILYDVNNGNVAPTSAEINPGVNESYHPDILRAVLQPIENAVSLIAKIELVRALNETADAKIVGIISASKFEDMLANNKITLNAVDQLLSKICKSIAPVKPFFSNSLYKPSQQNAVQQAIYDVLDHLDRDERGMLKVTSKQQVRDIVEAITVRQSEITLHANTESSKKIVNSK